MNLVVIHYHLNRGGVTSVIRNQIHALAGNSPINNVLILHGSGIEGWPGILDEPDLVQRLNRFEFREIPEIGYQDNSLLDESLFDLIDQSIQGCKFQPGETLIQVHNHNLGKNNSLMATLPRLVKESGYHMLLQIHDFAEDMRPDNFFAIRDFCRLNGLLPTDLVFPADPKIHFAFLNHRDLNLVQGRYIDESQCHLLPNPVSPQPLNHDPAVTTGNEGSQSQVRHTLGCKPTEKLIIYPVRAIRRKNVAEALLLAATGQDLRVAVTLPAESDDEIVQYQNTTQTADGLGIPIVFEAGKKGLDFAQLISAADFIFTSSIAEGFGMVFLESWGWGKHLLGRNLPDITHDFGDAGLNLSGMYHELKIPLEWIDLQNEREVQKNLLNRVLTQFEITASKSIEFEKEISQGWIDFAKLCHQTQLRIVEHVWNDREIQNRLLADNPKFRIPEFDGNLVAQNASTVNEHFTLAAFRKRFGAVLEGVFATEPASTVARKEDRPTQEFLVESFLDPQDFFPLRVERE